MASENQLPFDPNKAPDLIRAGKLRVVTTIEPFTGSIRSRERAKQLFGEDFLGVEAIHIMEEKCKGAGINVKFEIPQNTELTDVLLEAARADKAKGKNRLVVLRPEFMLVNGERKPLNLLNLRDLFEQKRKNGLSAFDNNPFGSGAVFYKYDPDWYANQDFAKEPQKQGFGLPTKEVLGSSVGKTWKDQELLLEPGERRREPVEVAWDTLLYYAATGKKLLENKWDWTAGRASGGSLVGVGGFDSVGLNVDGWSPGAADPRIGVCPSR